MLFTHISFPWTFHKNFLLKICKIAKYILLKVILLFNSNFRDLKTMHYNVESLVLKFNNLADLKK